MFYLLYLFTYIEITFQTTIPNKQWGKTLTESSAHPLTLHAQLNSLKMLKIAVPKVKKWIFCQIYTVVQQELNLSVGHY